MGIFVPIRGNAETVHADALEKVIVGFTLPINALMQNLLITLTAQHSSGAVRCSYQFPVMVSRLQSETPFAYKVKHGSASFMREDPDLEADVVANGDAGGKIVVTDDSSDAGTVKWNWQIWVLDEILLS